MRILPEKLKINVIEFSSKHGCPTQGTIISNSWVFYFRFRSHQFRISIKKFGIDCLLPRGMICEIDRVVSVKHLWDKGNIYLDDIIELTDDIFIWDKSELIIK